MVCHHWFGECILLHFSLRRGSDMICIHMGWIIFIFSGLSPFLASVVIQPERIGAQDTGALHQSHHVDWIK